MVKSCPFLIRNLPNDKATIIRQELKIKQLQEEIKKQNQIIQEMKSN